MRQQPALHRNALGSSRQHRSITDQKNQGHRDGCHHDRPPECRQNFIAKGFVGKSSMIAPESWLQSLIIPVQGGEFTIE